MFTVWCLWEMKSSNCLPFFSMIYFSLWKRPPWILGNSLSSICCSIEEKLFAQHLIYVTNFKVFMISEGANYNSSASGLLSSFTMSHELSFCKVLYESRYNFRRKMTFKLPRPWTDWSRKHAHTSQLLGGMPWKTKWDQFVTVMLLKIHLRVFFKPHIL